jgi:HTH-type transcriptional regulator / antitoxin HigA
MATKTRSTSQSRNGGKKRNAGAPGVSTAASRTRKGAAASGDIDAGYLALIRRWPLRPIRTEDELDAAFAIIDELTDRDELSAAEADYLDVLGNEVERYEDQHVAMPGVSDAEMLRTLMEEKGVTQADVVRGAGISKTVLSLVLNDKRDLTRKHIETLSDYFGISPAVFLNLA